jgi:hypothetical protein
MGDYRHRNAVLHKRRSDHAIVGNIFDFKNGSPRPNLEPFLEPFIAESAPKLLSGSI